MLLYQAKGNDGFFIAKEAIDKTNSLDVCHKFKMTGRPYSSPMDVLWKIKFKISLNLANH